MFERFHGACVSAVCLLMVACLLSNGTVRSASAEEAKKSEKQPGDVAHKANRLARETSPYLLLHAHNPVDWYPWGPEAFEKAKQENKPIFLSIGYSSCYWCHVMERLVFMNEEIARYMNEHFVNVKVDREERPDVDEIYMTALQIYFQAIGSPQGGGWPMSMFLTPEGKPFAGGTYFPPTANEGQLDFPTYMRRIVTAWKDERETLVKNADILTSYVRRTVKPGLNLNPVKLDHSLTAAVSSAIIESFDPQYGGIGFSEESPNAPKFPSPVRLAFLEYQAVQHGDAKAAEALDQTLDKLAAGGIRDHLGGGFHRYSTDRQWHVPHFEKMLYDQAQLADVYTAAYRRTKKPLYRQVAEETFDYVLREMTDARGGFHSALDAETDGVEGKYYVWSADEVAALLGADNAAIFKRVYGFNEPQVFEHGYVLHVVQPAEKTADLEQQLAPMRRTLWEARNKRKPLLKDDKILTSWNGLMIRALARGGAAFERADYTAAAEKAARFVLTDMRDEQGGLRRTYRGGQAKLNAYLDDYAFLIDGLLALNETTHNDEWLGSARGLADQQIAQFWDADGKGFFFTSNNHEELIARTRNAHDSVLPAGNSVSVHNLVRLTLLTGDAKYRTRAEETLAVFAPKLQESPGVMAHMAFALGVFLDESQPVSKAATPLPSREGLGEGGTAQSPLTSPNVIPQRAVERLAAKPPEEEQKPAEKNAKKKPAHKISAKAFLSVDKLTKGGTCRVVMYVDIADGWHINTNPAKPDKFIATEFTLKSKQGTTLTNVQYPAGKPVKVPGLNEPQHIYEKRAVIYGELKVPETVAANEEELELSVHYQACNDKSCLPPKTFKLEGKLPIVGKGEPVKQINQDKFPAKTKPKVSAK
ncbi:MAG: DUF255 domain-containing protein [Planctomycetaceae bacterium]